MSNRQKRFSLLVPSYNRPELIRLTILSLLENASDDVEIIVADDASPRQCEIRNALAEWIESGQIKWIGHRKNLGWSGNRNSLLKAASGEYVILLGDDDRLKAGAIEYLRSSTSRHPEVAIFGMGYDVIDEYGVRTFTFCTPKAISYRISGNSSWQEIFLYDAVPMFSHHPFTMCSKRTAALSIGYRQTVDIADDALYLCDALEMGHTFIALPKVLFEWRVAMVGNANYTTLSGSQERCHRSRGLLLAEWLSRPELRVEVKRMIVETGFLAKFCMISKSDVVELKKLMDHKPLDGQKMGDYICDKALGFRPSLSRLVGRQLRAIRVMGLGHIPRFLQYQIDKRRLRRIKEGAK